MARVPDEDMERLHEANGRFHQAGLGLNEFDCLGFKEQRDVMNAISAAEQELEDVTRKIDEVLNPAPPTAPAASHPGPLRPTPARTAPPSLAWTGGSRRQTPATTYGRSGGVMAKDIFHDRERAEEAAYFSQQDAKLIEKLRTRAKLGEIARALAEKLQVDDPALLDRIMKLGVTLDTGAAFILAPLVDVAWADGHVSEPERHAILQVAQDRGVAPGSADMNQLLNWLSVRPSDVLLQAALEAIKLGLSVLPRDEAEKRITMMVQTCELVAESSGGLARLLRLGHGVSRQERSVLDEIRRRLSGDAAAPGKE